MNRLLPACLLLPAALLLSSPAAAEEGPAATVVLNDNAPREVRNLLFDGQPLLRYRHGARGEEREVELPFANLRLIERRRFVEPELVGVDLGGTQHPLVNVALARARGFLALGPDNLPVSFRLDEVRLIVLRQGELAEERPAAREVARVLDTIEAYNDYLNRFPGEVQIEERRRELRVFREYSPRDLATRLLEPDPTTRGRIACAQGYSGNTGALEPLTAAFNREQVPGIKLAIVRAVGEIGSPAGEDFLVRVLNEQGRRPEERDRLHDLRLEAARGLGRVGGERAVNFLAQVFAPRSDYPDLVAEEDGQLLGAAINALGDIGSGPAANALIEAYGKFQPERVTQQNRPFRWQLYRQYYAGYQQAVAAALARCRPAALEVIERQATGDTPLAAVCRAARDAIRSRLGQATPTPAATTPAE